MRFKFPIPMLMLLPWLAFGDTLFVTGRKIVPEPAQFFPEQIFWIPGSRDSFIAGHLKDQSGKRSDFYVQKIGSNGEPLGQGRITLPFVEGVARMASIVRGKHVAPNGSLAFLLENQGQWFYLRLDSALSAQEIKEIPSDKLGLNFLSRPMAYFDNDSIVRIPNLKGSMLRMDTWNLRSVERLDMEDFSLPEELHAEQGKGVQLTGFPMLEEESNLFLVEKGELSLFGFANPTITGIRAGKKGSAKAIFKLPGGKPQVLSVGNGFLLASERVTDKKTVLHIAYFPSKLDSKPAWTREIHKSENFLWKALAKGPRDSLFVLYTENGILMKIALNGKGEVLGKTALRLDNKVLTITSTSVTEGRWRLVGTSFRLNSEKTKSTTLDFLATIGL